MVKSESARPTGQVIPHCRPFETIALGSLVVYWPDLMFESYRDPILSKQKCLWSLEIASDHENAPKHGKKKSWDTYSDERTSSEKINE